MLKEQQKNWAYQKYWVMAHSQQAYDEIRQLFKDNQWTAAKEQALKQILEKTALIPVSVKTLTTTYQHVWGYFKKLCTPAEKKRYLKLLQTLTLENDQLGGYLKELANKYQVEYLLNSRLLQEIN